MIIGQLFHYLSQLDTSVQALDDRNMSEVDIMGVSSEELNELVDLSDHELRRKVRDIFTGKYGAMMTQDHIKAMWNTLTSPAMSENNRLKSKTEYQAEVLKWIAKGNSLSEISDFTETGYMLDNEGDVTLYYAFELLSKLSKLNDGEGDDVNIELANTDEKLSTNPEILVLCSNYLAPLFVNLNAEFRNVTDDSDKNMEIVKTELANNNNLKLVLVVHKEYIEMVEWMNKKITTNALISGIDLDNAMSGDDSETYFDHIARKTLGIRI